MSRIPIQYMIPYPNIEIEAIKSQCSAIFDSLAINNVDLIFSPASTDITVDSIDDPDWETLELTPQNSLPVVDSPTWDPEDEDDIGTLPEPTLEEIAEDLDNYTPQSVTLSMELAFLSDLEIGLAGIEGVSIVLNPSDFEATLDFSEGNFQLRADVELAIRLSGEYLPPIRVIEGTDRITIEPDPSRQTTDISVGRVTLNIDSSGSLDISGGAGIRLLEPVMIGSTGVVIESADIALNLSGNGNRPAGVPAGWKGLMINNAKLRIPDVFSGAITATGLGIGSSGVSGTIGANLVLDYDSNSPTPFTGDMVGEIFGMRGGLQEISLTLQQNIPVGGSIRAKMLLPFFEATDEPLDIDIGIAEGGAFTVGIHSANGVLTLTKPDLIKLQLEAIGFSVEDGVATATLSGQIIPLFGGLDWPEFEVKALTIDSRGRVTIDGGWIDLPKQITVDFHGFGLEVSKIGFGTEDDGSRWIGFSGGLKLCAGLPMSAAVEGLRVNWKGSDIWMEFKGAEIAFEIPNSIAFEGRVEFIDDPNGAKGFRGSGQLKVIPSGLEINAELVVGRNDQIPAYTFFYIYLDAQLPAGIPLGQSGVAFYGVAGLFAYNMEPNKPPELQWFDGWYKGDPVGVSSSQKWGHSRGSFALGAEITLGTSADNGYAVSAKSLLVLVLPGPILMIEGRASFLQDRSKLSDDTPVKALTVLDARAGQLVMNIEASYPPITDDPSPSDIIAGMLIKVQAAAEAYFDFNNPSNWHLFIGQRDPKEKRVRALVYSIYEGNAYLMLDPAGFEMGAQIGYNANWKFGPLGITLQALIEGGLGVSWKPVQVKGGLGVIGQLALKAFGFSTGLSLSAWIEVEAPTPWRVFAAFDVKWDLPWPCPDQEAHIELEWQEAIPPPTPIPVSTVGIEHLKVSEKWELPRYPNYNTKADGLWYSGSSAQPGSSSPETSSPIVPLDAKIVLAFARPMIDAAKVGLNQSGIVAPERVGDYEFQYRIVSVKLERQSKTSAGGWELVARRSEDDVDIDKEKLWGAWLAVTGDSPSSGTAQIPSMTKLMLFAKSPFEYARETIDDTYFDSFSEWNPTYGRCLVNPPVKECFGFGDLLGKYDKEMGPGAEIRRGDVIIVGDNLYVRKGGVSGQESLLAIGEKTKNVTLIFFAEYIRQIELVVGEKTEAVVSYYDGVNKIGELAVVNGEEEPKTVSFPEKRTTNFNLLVIEKEAINTGYMELIRLCYITAREADRYLDEEDTANHASDAGDAYSYPPETELFLSHSYYRVKVVTEALRRRVGQGDFELVQRFEESSYFQTENPPGVDAPVAPGSVSPSTGDEHYPVGGPLRDLGPYVERDMLIPEEGAQAVYRSYDIGVEYNEAYVEHMYMLSGRPLSVYLYDNNGQGIELAEQEIAAVGNSWHKNNVQLQRRADLEWEATVARTRQNVATAIAAYDDEDSAKEAGHPAAFSGVPKVNLNSAGVPKQTGIWAGGEDMVLKPQTIYRATLVATEPQVVIPLTTDGAPIRINGNLQYMQITADGSNFVSAIEDSFGQAEVGVKIVSDGKRAIVTNLGASGTAQLVPIDRKMADTVVKEALNNVAPKPEPRSVFSWSFITSRFTSFVHHIHSFIDAAWDLRGTMGAAVWPDLTQAQQDELKGLIETPHPDLKKIYDKSIEFFSLEGRPLPERLEINLLKDDHGQYGFMIESPEPLEWRLDGKGRVTLKVFWSDTAMESPLPAYGSVKFIDCNLLAEWVEILVQTDIDLSDYKIERIYTDGSAPDLYYRFGVDSQYRAGTRIRIHSGSTPSEPFDLERKDIFMGTGADILSNSGETLRLSDTEGHEIHRRQFTPREFTILDTVIAPDSDGTRTFVFLRDKDSGEWINDIADGRFRFEWEFRRDAGSDLPILRRLGSTAPEQATLEFNVPAELP